MTVSGSALHGRDLLHMAVHRLWVSPGPAREGQGNVYTLDRDLAACRRCMWDDWLDTCVVGSVTLVVGVGQPGPVCRNTVMP